MDTTIPQTGSNVASQYIKPNELPVFERIEKVDVSDDAKSENSSAKAEQNLAAKAAQNAQAFSRDADTEQREESTVELEQALGDISEFLQSTSTQLAFSIDEATDRQVVTVKDADSGDVIRQIPSEEVLKIAERINELQSEFGSSAGLLLRGQA